MTLHFGWRDECARHMRQTTYVVLRHCVCVVSVAAEKNARSAVEASAQLRLPTEKNARNICVRSASGLYVCLFRHCSTARRSGHPILRVFPQRCFAPSQCCIVKDRWLAQLIQEHVSMQSQPSSEPTSGLECQLKGEITCVIQYYSTFPSQPVNAGRR